MSIKAAFPETEICGHSLIHRALINANTQKKGRDMSQLIELRDIPRGKLSEDLIQAARKLPKDPGAGHQGPCEMYRGSDGFPVCRGQCQGKTPCHLVIIGIEGSHSDLHNYLVFCTCMTNADLDRLIQGRAEIVELPQHRGAGKKG
jgi:hypothetical protein